MVYAQDTARWSAAKRWADSVYQGLSPEARVGQLIVARLSTIDQTNKKISFFDSLVAENIRKFDIGGICVFQGNPAQQVQIINRLQQASKIPLLITVDGEWGLGMRMADSVQPLPRQMMLGALQDSLLVYQYGRIVADQCRRFGIQMDFAPVLDINNNPNNPVINDRSFGEDKEKVALLGRQYVKGLQDAGVMACVKHFPGHGDVDTDSHYDLPVIHKSLEQLDSLELYPFKSLFGDGASSVMVGHLHIPAIDSAANVATSLSKKNVDSLLRIRLGFQGLSFTDALEMQAVKKFYGPGKAGLQALKAGNDMLLLPDEVELTVTNILNAIKEKEISWNEIEIHCKRVLAYKHYYGLHTKPLVDGADLIKDLNRAIKPMKRIIAEQAITLLNSDNQSFFPMHPSLERLDNKLALVAIGMKNENAFVSRLRKDLDPDVFKWNLADSSESICQQLLDNLKAYDRIVLSIHGLSRKSANNFNIGPLAKRLMDTLSSDNRSMTFLFGNPYAAKNVCSASNLAVCYEDDSIVHEVAADLLEGKIPYRGRLPVTVCERYKAGDGQQAPISNSDCGKSTTSRFVIEKLSQKVDSIIYGTIQKQATPGAQILIAEKGNILLHRGYGNAQYDYKEPVTTETLYDVASLTKILATTLSVMKLYDEKKINLKKKLSKYLPETKGTDKGNITIEQLLLHEGGLVPTIPFYQEVFDSSGNPKDISHISPTSDSSPQTLQIADNLFLQKDFKKIVLKKIIESKLTEKGKYVYSDNDFILLGLIVERISGQSLDQFVSNHFYTPLQLKHTGFLPLKNFSRDQIAPTQFDTVFRRQLLRGFVHDPGAAMLGGVAGHAGLFSNCYDLYVIMQMLMNNGVWDGKRYLKENTVQLFTSYHNKKSRRGLGFDKPEKDNNIRKEPYPSKNASSLTFGHTGFTGTCAWADPATGLVYIFLSNRVFPAGNDALVKNRIRIKILDVIYDSLLNDK
jgi:beta-glucosidase-like glycosyl hydrolase/CubicO group peptidase (beta-lactamase class C family)